MSTRVLLIDPDPTSRHDIARHLRAATGAEVRAFARHAEALAHLASTWHDYVALLQVGPRDEEKVLDSALPQLRITRNGHAKSPDAFHWPDDQAALIKALQARAGQNRKLASLATELRDLLEADLCLAWQLDRHNHRYRVAAWSGELDDAFREQICLDPDAPLLQAFLERGRARLLRDVTDEARVPHFQLRAAARARGWRGLVALPLVHQGRILGWLDAYFHEPLAPSARERRFLLASVQAFAKQAASAARNSELSAQMRSLQRITQSLAGTFDEQAILQQILDKGLELVGADIGWLYVRDPHREMLLLKAVAGLPEDEVEAERPLGKGITGLAACTGQTQHVPDLAVAPHHIPLPGLAVQSEIAVPLCRDAHVIGVLTVKSRQRYAFADDDVTLLTAFANQAAIALQQQQRATDLQQLAQVGQSLTESLTIRTERLLKQVATFAHRLTGADCITIYPYDPVARRFYEREGIAVAGHLHHPPTATTHIPREGGLASLIREAGVVVAHHIAAGEIEIGFDSPPQPTKWRVAALRAIAEARFIQEEGIQAFVGVSLRANERIQGRDMHAEEVGTLYINFRAPHRFTPQQLQVIRIFAHQVANVIRGARLYAEATRQAQELEAVHQTALRIVSSADVSSLLHALVEEATQLLRGTGGVVYLRDERQPRLRVVAAENVDPARFPLDATLRFDQGVAGRVMRTGDPCIINDYANWPERIEPLVELCRMVIAVPLWLGEELIGVLSVFDDRPERHFSHDDVPILARLAQQASLALHSARLVENLKKKNVELEVLNEIGRRAVSALGVDAMSQLIYDQTAKLLDVANFFLCLYDAPRQQLHFRTWIHNGEPLAPFSRPLGGLTGWVIAQRRSLLIRDAERERRNLPPAVITTEWQRSWLGVPLCHGDEVIGVMAVQSPHPNTFSTDTQQLMETIASQAAIALRNAQLYTEMEKRVAERTHAWRVAQEQSEANAELALLGEVGVEMAHRINNLAGSIPVRINLAREKLADENPRDQAILRQLDHIAGHVQPLLQSVQTMRAHEAAPQAQVLVQAALEEAWERVKRTLVDGVSHIRWQLAVREPLTVLVEQSRLVDTLTSIAFNAVEAMPQGGTLTMGASRGTLRDHPCIDIAITDTGVGIPASHLPKIFDRWFTTKEKGLGYGLWRDRLFIKSLGGEIEVESTVGQGTTFTLKLPLAEEPQP